MRLVLVRHGEAENLRSTDAARTLTGLGRSQAARTGAWLADILTGVPRVRILVSPYRRARETADIIGGFLPSDIVEVATITPDHDPRTALSAIDEVAGGCECVVVVTHMPLVAALASWIESGVLSSAQGFGLAEARLFDLSVLGAGAAAEKERYVPDMA